MIWVNIHRNIIMLETDIITNAEQFSSHITINVYHHFKVEYGDFVLIRKRCCILKNYEVQHF